MGMEPQMQIRVEEPQNAANFTSTPCLAEKAHVRDSGPATGGPVRGIMSTGGISIICDPRTLKRPAVDSLYPPNSAGSSRNPSFGYPLSFLTEGDASANLTTHTISEIVPRRLGMTLTCHKVSMKRKVNTDKLQCFKGNVSSNPQQDVILSDVSAYFPPGLNAVIGPSGCGKTSLLSALSLRNKHFDGGIRLNGNYVPGSFAKLCGYSIQDDILNPGLTVRQHIWFSLCLRRVGRISHHQKRALVMDILKSLQLEHRADEKVGDLSDSKISGGERKRVGIGMELVAAPKIIFLDEPTSSLDSTTSKYILRILKCLADNGRTIILTIHQPSFALYRMFDNMTLMAKGRLIYHGPAPSALDYFTSLGFPHQPHYAPPDFFLDILFGKVTSNRRRRSTKSTPHPIRHISIRQTDVSPTYWTTVEEGPLGNRLRLDNQIRNAQDSPTRPMVPIIMVTRDSQGSMTVNNNVEIASPKEENVFCPTDAQSSPDFLDVNIGSRGYASELDATTDEGVKGHAEIARLLAEEYSSSSIGRELQFRLHEIQNQSLANGDLQVESKDGLDQASVLEEFIVLSQRGLGASVRLCGSLVVMNMVIGLLFGLFYYHKEEEERPPMQNRLGMFFYLSVHGIMVPSIITAKSFATTEEALFEHEKRGGYYRPISFCLSRCAILVLIRLLSAASLSTIIYWMTGLKPDGGPFLLFMTTLFVSGLACDSLCLACVLGCKSFAVGKSVAILYKSLTSVFAGFLVNLETTFPWLAWIKYISISRYCFVAWVVGEFSNVCVQNERKYPKNETTPSDGVIRKEKGKCGTEAEQLVMMETVAQDEFLMEHVWTNHVILLGFAFICLMACYYQMRKIV